VRRAACPGPASAVACCCSCSPRPRGAARPRRAARSATSRTGAGCGADARAPDARLKLKRGTRTEIGGQSTVEWLALMQVFHHVLDPACACEVFACPGASASAKWRWPCVHVHHRNGKHTPICSITCNPLATGAQSAASHRTQRGSELIPQELLADALTAHSCRRTRSQLKEMIELGVESESLRYSTQ
jgi:hypothetical protein